MPTLLIGETFQPVQRLVYRAVFSEACTVLDIASYDCTVTLREGHVSDREGAAAAIIELEVDHYLIIIKDGSLPGEGMFSLCHEMIHLKQYLTGALRNIDDGAYWHDDFHHVDDIHDPDKYLSLPWEVQAFAIHSQVFRDVMKGVGVRLKIAAAITDLAPEQKQGENHHVGA